jgi:transcription-repair coupling factor (superfamily II helicase)
MWGFWRCSGGVELTFLSKLPDLPITAPLTGGEIVCINSLRSYVLANLSTNAPLLVIAPSTRIADELSNEIHSLIGDHVIDFPAWETLPHERLSPKSDTVTNRFKSLNALDVILGLFRSISTDIAFVNDSRLFT